MQETIWMDRYHVDNRVKIRKGRARARELKKEVEEVREKRDRLAVTKVGRQQSSSESRGTNNVRWMIGRPRWRPAREADGRLSRGCCFHCYD